MATHSSVLAWRIPGRGSLVGCLPSMRSHRVGHDWRDLAAAVFWGWLPWWVSSKVSTCQCRRHELDHWVKKIPWRRKWQLTLVFLPGKFHGQRSLVGYSPWSCKRVQKQHIIEANIESICFLHKKSQHYGVEACLKKMSTENFGNIL